ncbi:MAG TPA: GrpB family protein [Mycobacteriales bacterium]|nr:GrpB family protein [Mycobacteriales bacterium]
MVVGLPYDGVDVVESDPEWPGIAADLAACVSAALGDSAESVEHVGSTAVPGLAAKPIIDLAVELAARSDPDSVVASLTAIGLIYRGFRSEVGDWLFHARSNEGDCIAIVHVVPAGDPGMAAWLTVRDRLRADPELRERYARLKKELARRFPDDRPSYSRGKAEFIRRILSNRPERGNAHDTPDVS